LPTYSQNSSWTAVGPINFPIDDIGQIDGIGRVSQLKFDPVNPTRMYAVAPHGVFVSNDTASTWNIVPGTNNFPTGTGCAATCIDRTNNNTLYVGTGDANYYSGGSGVWKSTDGGNTFTQSNTGMGNVLVIEIIMSPTDANTLVAATNAGIYKTTNGGGSWTLTSPVDQITDMRVNRGGGSTTIYAISRTSQNFYRSTDMGSTWVTQNIGPSTLGAGRLAVTPADTNVVYLGFIGSNSTTGGVIYRSTDGGVTFTQQKGDTAPDLVGYSASQGGQGNYNFDIEADPVNADTLYLCAHVIWKSTDAGVTWTQIQASWAYVLHTDQHGLRFNPNNYNQLFNVNDGGVWINRDQASTNTWTPRSQGLISSEFYHFANSHSIKYLIDGGLQDNAEVYLNYNTNLWHCNRGGDFTSRIFWDYSNTNWAYYGGNGNRRNMLPFPSTGSQVSLGLPGTVSNNDLYAFSYQNGNVSFYAQSDNTNHVYGLYSTANLQAATPTWTQLSGFSPTTQMLALTVSPADANILYLLSNNKSIVRSTNALSGSPTFTTVTSSPQPSGTPANGSIAILKSGVVYMSADGYVFRSADQGSSWTAVGSGPVTATLNGQKVIKLIADTTHAANEVIYAITRYGVYYKDITLPDWAYYTASLPSTAGITDADIFYDAVNLNNSLLRVSTYGRGCWEVFLAGSTPVVPPTVSITSPASGATFLPGSNIVITATASSPNAGGSIAKVDFYQGSTLLGTSTTAPYSFTWMNVATGGYSLTAVATDNKGAATTSTVVSILVGQCTSPAVIPQSNMHVIYFDSQETTCENGAATNAIDGNTTTIWHTQYCPSVASLPHEIQLSLGGTYLVNTFKYLPRQSGTNGYVGQYEIYVSMDSTNWGMPVATGTFPADATEKVVTFTEKTGKYVRFRALTEAFGQQYTSAAELNVAGCLQTANQPPVVSITSPANNANFTPGSNITINATASSPNTGGSISKVDFYQGTTLLGTSTTSPYSFTWTNVPAGSYSLTAKATDNLNATTTSAAINITVSTPVCNAPTGLTTTSITATSATANWTAVSGAANYDADYQVNGASTWTNAATGTTATSVNLTGLTAGTSYNWRVRTNCTAGGSSGYSQASFTTATATACPDIYEPNGSFATAAPITVGTAITANIKSATESDWFNFRLNNGNSTNIRVTLSNLPADYDLYLYNSSDVQIGSSTNTGLANEVIVHNAGTRRSTYYIKVVSKAGAFDSTKCYTLIAETSSTPWPAVASAPALTTEGKLVIPGSMQLFPNPANTAVTLRYNSERAGNASVNIITADGRKMMTKVVGVMEGMNDVSLDIANLPQGVYIVEVRNGDKQSIQKLSIIR